MVASPHASVQLESYDPHSMSRAFVYEFINIRPDRLDLQKMECCHRFQRLPN